CQQYDGFPFTF
nr:immunoglobulin light chain junction region [Macaca mulatta]